MRKTTLAIAAAALFATSASWACGNRCGVPAPHNVTSGSVSASASIPFNGQGTAIGKANLLTGSYSNTDALGYRWGNSVHAGASGNTISWFEGSARSIVFGGVGPSARASFSGSTRVDVSRCEVESTYWGDHFFDYEAASAKVNLGSSISGRGVSTARNVYGPYTSERVVRVVGDATSEADVYGRTIGNRETKTNVDLDAYARGDVLEGSWGVNGIGEYAAGQIDVNAYARGDAQARD